MSMVERQVRRAQSRLMMNVLLRCAGTGVLIAAGLFGLLVVADRALSVGVPTAISLPAAAALALLIAAIGTWLARVNPLQAAVAVDTAAGLRERLSTALAVMRSEDPFARATVRDAEKAAGSVHVSAHVPVRAPDNWPWSMAAVCAAGLLYAFMPTLNLFASDTKSEPQVKPLVVSKAERKQVEDQVNDQLNKLKKFTEENASLKDLSADLKPLEIPDRPDIKPDDIRREALKKLDNVADKLNERREADDLKSLEQLKKEFAEIKPREGKDAASKLMQELANGDIKGSKEAIDQLKKELDEAARDAQSPEAQKKLDELSEKLDDLAKQLEKQAQDDARMQKELQNKAGLSEDQAKKMCEQAAKMDAKQLEKELQKALGEKGMTQEQIKELAKKLAQNAEAKKQAQKLAEQMKKAAQACKNCKQGQQGQGEAAQGQQALADAADQLSDMEMAEQLANELEAQLSELKDAREGMCQGNQPGDKQNDDIGNQGPQEGRGYGARIGREAGAHQYKASRVKSQGKSGQIIGEKLIDGPQIKGEASAETREAISAALRDATDAIERDQIPRAYEKVVRNYFLALAGLAGVEGDAPKPEKPAEKP